MHTPARPRIVPTRTTTARLGRLFLEPLEPRVVLTGGFGLDLSYVDGTWDFGGSFFDYNADGSLNFSSRQNASGAAQLAFSEFVFTGMTSKNSMTALYAPGATTFDNQVGAGFDQGGLGYLYEWNNAGSNFRLSFFLNQATALAGGDRDGTYFSSGVLFDNNARVETAHAFTGSTSISGTQVNAEISGPFGSIPSPYTIASEFPDGFTELNNAAWLLFTEAAGLAFSGEVDEDDGFRSIALGGRTGTGFTAASFEGKTISGVLFSTTPQLTQQVAQDDSLEQITIRFRENGQAEIFNSNAFYSAINAMQSPGQGELGTYTLQSSGSVLLITRADGTEVSFRVADDMSALMPLRVFESADDEDGFNAFGGFTVVMTGEDLPAIVPPMFNLSMITETAVSFDSGTNTNRITLLGATGETPWQFDITDFTLKADAWAKSDGSGYYIVGQTASEFVIREFGLGTTPIGSLSKSGTTGGTLFDSSGFHHSHFGERISFTGFDTMGDPIRYSWTPTAMAIGEATFTNIGQNLRDNGSSVPMGLDSATADAHETDWGTLLISVKDSSGRTINIWTTEGLDRYFSNDINTAAAESDTLGGRLSVTSADYGGITVTGLDSGGRLGSFYWHYTFGADWRYARIGDDAGAPLADGNSISSHYDPRDNSYNHYYSSTDLSTGYNLRWRPSLDKWLNYDLSSAYPAGFTEDVPMSMVRHDYMGSPVLYGWVGTSGVDDNLLRAPLDTTDIYRIDDNGTPGTTTDDFGLLNSAFRVQLMF